MKPNLWYTDAPFFKMGWTGWGFRRNPPAYHPTPHHAAFSAMHSANCNYFCGGAVAELEAWSGIECRTFFGVSGFAPEPDF